MRFTPNQHLLAESCDLVGVLDFEHDLARAGAATNADKNVRARSEPKKKGPRTKDETKMSFLSRRDLDGGERAEQCVRPRERAEETARPGRERDLEVLLVDEEILVLARPRQTDRENGLHEIGLRCSRRWSRWSTCEAGDLDLVHARVQVPDAARALLRRARHAVVEAVDRTNNRDPRQLRSTERERERREGEGENERSVMDSSKPENERFSDSAFADSLRAWPHVSPA